MIEYSKEELKNLVTFLKNLGSTPDKCSQVKDDHHDLIRFLETTDFSPLLFPDWVEANGEYEEIFSVDTEDLPLLVNNENEQYDPIIMWRLREVGK
jgi:hypothetical protein